MKRILIGLAFGLAFVVGMAYADNFGEVRVPAGGETGGIRVDASGRLCIFGPNISSCAVTIDGQDKVQVGDAVGDTQVRLRVTDDFWATGHGRFGPDCGSLPLDPDGAISLCRATSAQNQSFIRIVRDGVEQARIGLTANDELAFMREGADDPGLVITKAGKLGLRDTEVGGIRGYLDVRSGALVYCGPSTCTTLAAP